MKKYMKWHKYSAIIMIISALICICTGHKRTMKCHKKSAVIMALSGLVCIWSGHKMVTPKKSAAVAKDTEEELAGAAKETAEEAKEAGETEIE